MDEIDSRILRVLGGEGRISNAALAERIGLSASACLRRVTALERSGVIRGYRAVLDAERMGVGFTAYLMVGLNDHTKSGQEAFERAAVEAPEVVECHNVTGASDYLLRIEARDIADYKRIHTDVLSVLPQIGSLTTHVVVGSPKAGRS